MKASTFRCSFVNRSIVLFSLLASIPVGAEITPDDTLPNNSVVTPAEENTTRIQEGTQRGGNLFHSFQEFSIESGDTARFEHDSGIENIITRVRGAASNIDGTIQTRINGTTDKGSANLFIINPRGIIFGGDASLDIGGSFIGSTADSIKFADQTEFSATDAQNSSLLTVSVPLGLQFGSNPGEIVNRSQVNPNGEPNSAGLPIGLKVPNGETLALVGGNLEFLEGGSLTAREGRIELGSVAANSLVSLNQIETGYALGYTDVQNFGDIILEERASIDASGEGGGAIQVQGKNINLTESAIFAFTEGSTPGKNLEINASESLKLNEAAQIGTFAFGEAKAGDIIVKASDSIELVGVSSDNGLPSGFFAQVFEGTGNGGDIRVETSQLSIKGGAVIDASTVGAGNAGNILVKASDTIQLVGRTPNFENASGIFAQVAQNAIEENTGSAGNINIKTRQLNLEAGAQISSAGRKEGNGGNVNVDAKDSITVTGSSPTATLLGGSSGIFATAEGEGATGNPGQLDITTGLLRVENGGKISVDNRSTGEQQQQGNLTLNVDNLVIRDGGLVQARTFNTGPGGNLIVNDADSVEVSGFATGILGEDIVNSRLSVNSEGTGTAGNLEINANRIELDNQGKLIGETRAVADGGNIILNLNESLFLRRGSRISTSAGTDDAPGDGGNISINTPNGFIIAVPEENSDITANAFSDAAGRVEINSQGVFGIEARQQEDETTSDITASSQEGPQGVTIINAPDDSTIQEGLVELPQNLIDSEALVANSCVVRSNQTNGTFFITGKSGLQDRPGDAIPSKYSTVKVQPVPNHSSTKPRRWKIGDKPFGHALRDRIVEPTGVYHLENGQRILSRECGK